jgi:hypothetical protein
VNGRQFFILYADRRHIHDIIRTIQFLDE